MITNLFDHVATIYRATETLNALREKINTWTAQATPERMFLDTSPFRENDEGAGRYMAGTAEGFMRAAADVQEGDVIDVTSGPNAPRTLRVLNADRLRGHHTELLLEQYRGTLT
jgi:hypothetical protein